MNKYAKLLVALFLSASSLIGCAGMKLQPFDAGVVLPYSGNCFFVNVLTKKEVEYPKAVCQAMVKRSVILTSEAWKILRKNIQDNCQVQQCKQIVGQFDQLFLVVDSVLQKAP
jgi:hypothetical protein